MNKLAGFFRFMETPYSDRTAWVNLLIWSALTAFTVSSIILDIIVPVGWWAFLVNGLALLVDARMLTLAIRGMHFRRRVHAAARLVIQALRED